MITNYFISLLEDEAVSRNVIHDPITKLKIKVIDLLKSKFKPSKGEVQYFVTCGNKKLAFETQGYNRHRNLLILHMIAMYCVYLGLLDAHIQATQPYIH